MVTPEHEINGDFSHDLLEACVRRHLTDCGAHLRFMRFGTGKFNSSYVVSDDLRELVLRIAPSPDALFVFYERDMMRQEPELHQILLDRTTVPVPRILAADTMRDLVGRDFLLMERLPGTPISHTRGNTRRALQQVGEALAQVHRQTRDRYGYLGQHAPMEPKERWVDAFEVMWTKLVEGIVEIGYYNGAETRFILSLLEKFRSIFDRPVPASLLHMDVWAENILVDDSGNLTGLIDWDRALWGDPEMEFAVLDYCGISEPPFWDGYGQERDLSPEARLRQTFYLLYELQKYIIIRHGRNNDPGRAGEYKEQVTTIIRQVFGSWT